MASPTERTLALYRAGGYDVAVVEKYVTIPGRKFGVRRDAFGFIDILAFDCDYIVAIQATSTSNLQARVNKILNSETARRWCNGTSRRIMVIGWRRYSKPVNRRWWRETTQEIVPGDFIEQT